MHTTRKVLAGVFFVVTLALGVYATVSGADAPEPVRDDPPATFLIEGDRPADAGSRLPDV